MDGWVLWSLRSYQYLQTSRWLDRFCPWVYGTTYGVKRDNLRLRPRVTLKPSCDRRSSALRLSGFSRWSAFVSDRAASFPFSPRSLALSSVPSVKSVVSPSALLWRLGFGPWVFATKACFAKRTQFRSINTGLSQNNEPISMTLSDVQPPAHPAVVPPMPAQSSRIEWLRNPLKRVSRDRRQRIVRLRQSPPIFPSGFFGGRV
jgi:hypothetical protein